MRRCGIDASRRSSRDAKGFSLLESEGGEIEMTPLGVAVLMLFIWQLLPRSGFCKLLDANQIKHFHRQMFWMQCNCEHSKTLPVCYDSFDILESF